MEVSGDLNAPAALSSLKDPDTHKYEAGWAPRPFYAFGKAKNLSPLTEFKPRIVQPVAAHWT
jgi:hypothetical protein